MYVTIIYKYTSTGDKTFEQLLFIKFLVWSENRAETGIMNMLKKRETWIIINGVNDL